MLHHSYLIYIKKYGWLPILILFILGGGLAIFLRSQTIASPPGETETAPLLPTPVPADFEGVLRISIRETGMYRLTNEDLSNYGLDTIPPADLRLFNLGTPQTIWYSGQGETLQIYFYGQPLDTSYTLENVYFLTTKDNTPPASIQISDPQPLNAFPPPLHLEENAVYVPKSEPNRTWFWQNLTAPKTETFEIMIPQFAPGEATVRVALYANTEAANIDPDHHLLLHVNDNLLVDHSWDGRGIQVLEQTLTSDVLREGANTLTLELPGDTGAIVETILLDWIEIQYPHSFSGEKGRAEFSGTGNGITLTDFRSPPFIFDLSLTGDGSPFEIQPSDNLQFPTEPDHTYVALTSDSFLSPLSISPAQLSPDMRTARANYLAIGPPDLLEPLQPLLEYRASQGLASLSIPVTAIYDQFGGGIPHPEAIRSFLQYAYQTWPTPPKYVLLLGDSTYDPRGYEAPLEANRVPSFFRFTFFGGETVSDTAFAQLDDDSLPDLIVGRIPARTVEQVSIIVEKTLAYEQTPGQGVERILAIADGQEASFQTDAQIFLSHFSENYTPVELSPPKGDTTAPAQISEILSEGVLFMSYFGHGSITMLGKDRIFSVEDSAALTNKGNLPIMINSTCLAGLFTHPEAESLTEAMLWNPNGGAVAALSATSLTLPSDQAFLTNAFVVAFIDNPDASLGELLLMAQRQIPGDQQGVREVMDTFLLFGDPALKLP